MGKIRGGYLIKHRIQTLFRWSSPMGYRLLDSPSPPKPISRFCRWTRNLQSKIKSICCGSKNMVSIKTQGEDQTSKVPKGYMPVYVGRKDGDFDRVLVPVIYFNDPLFGQLLRDAEDEFGYDHPGAITIPCNISEFEHVRTRIKERTGTRKILRRK